MVSVRSSRTGCSSPPQPVLASLADPKLWAGDVAATIERPALVTQGTEDVLVLESTAASIKQQIAHATVSQYEGVGHAPFSEAAERFNNELAEFARSNAGA